MTTTRESRATTAEQPSTTTSDPAPKRATSDKARAEARLGWMLAGPAFAVMLLVTAYPILQAF